MNVRRVLFFCFLSALCEGDSGLVSANTQLLIRTEGSSMTAVCHFTLSRGRRKFLCKDDCKEGNILVETEGEQAQSGRFSIRYRGGTFPLTSTLLYVSISQLSKSDSGRYWCGLERPFLPDSYRTFEIRVTDVKTGPEALKQQRETAAVHSVKVSRPGYVLPLVVCVTVVVLFAVVVLLLFKLKTSLNTRGQSDDRNMEFTTYENFPPISRCEESSNNQDKYYSNL